MPDIESKKAAGGMTRRQLIAAGAAVGANLCGIVSVLSTMEGMPLGYGSPIYRLLHYSTPGELKESIMARVKGSYTLKSEQDLVAFPGAVVSGDIVLYNLDVFPWRLFGWGRDIKSGAMVTSLDPNRGTLAEVLSQMRFNAPFGAHIEYPRQGESQEQVLRRKLIAMIGNNNCQSGCGSVQVWKFQRIAQPGRTNTEVLTEVLYTRDQIEDLNKLSGQDLRVS